ncbi:interferon-inducible GTPase 5-like [Polyodon spathula]|uniref:interferon-inducible GTPase 5-like n=1 Tax=Polyodon spathula TaxID=7913 RepID=UPI001B7E7B8B|nr:interferon-inducible GTPase 5-like [Polyodon spathula]XP_041082749.1 interferon-inducible GTPase 5-like [Polyodon spathula]
MAEFGFEEIGEDEIQQAMESGGLAGAAKHIQAYLESLDSVEVNIAITGESGAGKSSFVNAFRGLEEQDEGAAPTGVVETTMEPKEYPHPKFPNVTIWDLPGIGTPNFKADEYLEQVNFQRYDFFIIIASERFRSSNATLAMKIQEMKKKFYFVRSKIDDNLRAESRKRGYSEEKTLDQIRQDCVKCLQDHGVKEPLVFLISSFDLHLYDFNKLEETLENELPEHKRHILLLSLPNISLQVLKRKQEALRARIWKLAALSCGVAVVPIPGLSVVCDVTILVKELSFYYNTFSLDEESLQSLAQRVNKPVEDLKSVIKSPLAKELSADVVLKLLTKAVGGGLMVVEYWASTFPIFGSAVAGGISFGTTYHMLKSCLEELGEDSCNVLKKAFETEV